MKTTLWLRFSFWSLPGRTAVILAGFLLWAPPAWAAVGFAAVANSSGGAVSSLTYSLTVPAGTDRFLIVSVQLGSDCTTTAVPTVNSVTYAGVALTQIASIVGTPCGVAAGGNNTTSQQWGLVAPATGTNNVVVTLSGATTWTIHSGAMAFTGVDQTVPVRASATASGGTSTSNGTSSTVTVTSAVGDMVVNTVGQGTGITAPGSGQTQRFLNNVNTSNTLNNSAGSTAPGAAGSVTMTWTFTASDEWQTISSSLAPSVATASQGLQKIVCKSTGVASTNCAWNTATTTGNLLLMVVATAGDTSAPTITVAAPWVNVDATKYPYYPGSPAPQVGMWYIANASSRSGNETVNLSAAKDTMITLIEMSGMATSGVVDQTARSGSTSTGTPINSGTTATTTQANEYWLAVGTNRYDSTTPGSATGGFTNIAPTTGSNPSVTTNTTTSSGIGFAVADQTVSATGTANATWPLGTSRARTGIVATFKGCSKPVDADYVAISSQSGQATVYWSSANAVTILWKSGAAFTTEAPADGQIYVAGESGGTLGAARVAYDSASLTADTNVTCTATTCTHTGLTNGTTYYYKVFANSGSGGASCYAPGTVNTSGGISATPNTGTTKPDWTYMMAGGSVLKAGIASWNNTIYTSSNANRLISLNTTGSNKGGQNWAPRLTTAPIQGWLTWLPGISPVQSGTVAMTATSQSVAITPVNPSRAFVLCIQRDVQSDAGRRTDCELSASSITFNAGETGTVVQWYVVEFPSGVSVQRGTVTFATTDTIQNVPISVVNLAQSFVLLSEWTLDTFPQNIDEEWTMRARLTSSTNLELSRNIGGVNPANQPVTVAWQVVTMSAATVQRGTACIGPVASCPGSDGATTTVTLSPAVTPGQSFLVFTRRGPLSGGLEGQYQVMGQITGSGGTLTFTRAINTTNIVDISWEVVSLSDGTTVQRNTTSVQEPYTTDAPVNVSLSPAVSLKQSVPLISVAGVLNGSTTGDPADLDSTTFTAMFTDADLVTPCSGTTCPNLQMVRASNPNANAYIYWQVVQFATNRGWAVVIGGEQGSGTPLSGRVISVDPAIGITNWEVNLRSVTGVDADAFQAPAAAQMRAYSSATFQSTYTDDVIFVATRNSSSTPVCGSMSTNNKVFALKASDGSVLWTFNGTCTSSMDYVVGMPAVDYARNRLYVASHAGGGSQPSLWIIDTLTGNLVQSFALGHIDASPTPSYDGTTLYVANTSGNLYAINLNTLTLKWATPNYMSLGSTINGFVWEDGSLSGILYFSTADGNVWCIRDPGVGASPPSTPPASPQAACPWKTLVNGTGVSNLLPLDPPYTGIYVGAADGKLHRVNPTTGVDEKQFTVDATPRTVGDPSTATGNEVFASTTEGRVYKILLPLP